MHATSPDAAAALEAHNLIATRGGATVLDGLDLRVRPGESVALRGPSGSGKSTLLFVLAGLLPLTSGTVMIAGERMDGASDAVRSRLRLTRQGLVFQGDEFVPELTIGENITLPLRLAGHTSHRYMRNELKELVDRLGISGLESRRPNEVSGGQLQRAAVARSVIHRPAVVLADEPTGSLDQEAAGAAMGLLLSIARENGSAALIVTHDDASAVACDRSMLLSGGRLETLASHVVGS